MPRSPTSCQLAGLQVPPDPLAYPPGKGRQQDGDQQGDDGNDDQQFNKKCRCYPVSRCLRSLQTSSPPWSARGSLAVLETIPSHGTSWGRGSGDQSPPLGAPNHMESEGRAPVVWCQLRRSPSWARKGDLEHAKVDEVHVTVGIHVEKGAAGIVVEWRVARNRLTWCGLAGH